MIEKIFTLANVQLRGYDADNVLIFEDCGHNLIVTTGEDHVADQMADQSESAMSHMAVGTDNTAPAAAQTALGVETARVALDSKTHGAGIDANTVTYIATFAPGVGTGSLREAGIFNASSGGVMLARYTFVYDKGSGDTLVIEWEISFAAA